MPPCPTTRRRLNPFLPGLLACALVAPLRAATADELTGPPAPETPETPALLPASLPASVWQTAARDEAEPWRLDSFLKTPDWLTLRGDTRIRYERIDGQYSTQPGLDPKDQVIYQRTRLEVEARGESVGGLIEIVDSRQRLAGPGTRINTGDVDVLDVAQAYVDFDLGPLGDGRSRLRLGRETVDVGSRRLMARPRYRNTLNMFTGVDWLYEEDDGTATRAFWLLPVQRRPGDKAALIDNDQDYNTQSSDLQFFGVHHTFPVGPDTHAEVYAFGLDETDLDTRRRSLYTPGARVRRAPAVGAMDYELELAVQVGDSRAGVGGRRLDHRANMQHASVGYTFDAPTQPRVRIRVDRASGDRDPTDGINQRFDPLYGVRREYGPTSMWPGVALSNIVSPAVGVDFRPTADSRAWFSWRGTWLDSDRDAFVTTGSVDPTGNTGDAVGQVLEGRYAVNVVPDSVRLEFGAVHLFADEVLTDVPNSARDRDSTYGYAQATWTF